MLSLGVRAVARWTPSPRSLVRVRGAQGERLPISEDVTRRLVRGRPGSWSVELAHDLPIGQGFGTSAAGALATGWAIGRLVGASRRTVEEVAHLADLYGGGGLGGVVAIRGGGLEIREQPGLPPAGVVVRSPYRAPLLVGTLGPPLWSSRLLRDRRFLERLEKGRTLFAELLEDPTPSRFWEVSERFTDLAGICPPPLARLLLEVRRGGGHAFQTMFGSAFVATAEDEATLAKVRERLRRRKLPLLEAHVASRGAHGLPGLPRVAAPASRAGARSRRRGYRQGSGPTQAF